MSGKNRKEFSAKTGSSPQRKKSKSQSQSTRRTRSQTQTENTGTDNSAENVISLNRKPVSVRTRKVSTPLYTTNKQTNNLLLCLLRFFFVC